MPKGLRTVTRTPAINRFIISEINESKQYIIGFTGNPSVEVRQHLFRQAIIVLYFLIYFPLRKSSLIAYREKLFISFFFFLILIGNIVLVGS